MKRAFGIGVAIAAVAAAVVLLVSSLGGSSKPHYRVVLTNAFGLTQAADVRVAGVKVGSVSSLDVDPRTANAIVDVTVQRPEFGGLRRDAFCTVQPQSLIGEYFLDCQPGSSPQRLGDGGTVPVSQTAGTVPPDLVADILRRPYRERLAIILTELGAGFGARGQDVNDAIRRAVPALRETDRVLGLLFQERQTIQQLTRDGDTVLAKLSGNRANVARFVATARDTAVASANRRTELAGTIRRLPAFERALRPTLADLGTAARLQAPALADLRAAAPDLTRLLQRLGPFATATRPALRSLGRASVTGRGAMKAAAPTIRKLKGVAATGRQPLTNLRFVAEHLDDRANAVEPNPESPGGKGFTGLEAFLQYPFVQSQAINLFDARGYMLKIDVLLNECSKYTNGAGALRDPARTKRCSGALGPGGKIEPATQRSTTPAADQGARLPDLAPSAPQAPATPPAATPQLPVTPPATGPLGLPTEIRIPGLPPIKLPDLGLGLGGGRGSRGGDRGGVQGILDYLLAP